MSEPKINRSRKIRDTVEWLARRQKESGEFRSLCYLPGAETPIWYYSGPSPFLTANVLYCLSDLPDPVAASIIDKGLNFLTSLMGPFGLWRYWEHDSEIMEYNVPNDLDDTCLVCWLLERHGRACPDNRELLIDNILPAGRINTWLLPRWRFLRKPWVWLYLALEWFRTRPVFSPNPKLPDNEAISSPNDSEAGVEAHALMYLGRVPEIVPVVKALVQSGCRRSLRLQYYDHPSFAYYHLSRAYRAGFLELAAMKKTILEELEDVRFSYSHSENYLRYAVNCITLKNFGWLDYPLFREYHDFIVEDPIWNGNWRAFKYWTSKQRSWWAGSPELTAALYIQAASLDGIQELQSDIGTDLS